MNDDLRIPDIEIIIGAAGDDVAVFAFYNREDIHQGYDIACAITDKDARPAIRQILQDAIKAINDAVWVTLDELGQSASDRPDAPPF